MGDRLLNIRVFVASPGDVSEERAGLEEIVTELNLTWSKTLNLSLELVRWETHVNPGVGKSPQDVVNRQIGDYDVFIGILWARFGTPTPQYSSGTEEEFSRALGGYRSSKIPSDIMVYFKDAPISPSQMEPEQLGKVQRFKGGLGAEGVLFSTFNSRDQFEHLLRLHLSRVAQRFAVSISDSGITKAAGADSEAEGDEDLGFLDHLELGGQAFEIATSSLGRMNDAMTAMNDAMTARTSEIAAVYRPDGSYEIQAMKKVAAGVAQDLNEFASRAEAEIPIFRDSYLSAVNHLCFSATMSVQDFNVTKEVLVPVRDAILAHKQGIPTVIDSVTTMKTMVTGLPRITGLFNKAKRNVAAAVEKQLEALEFARKASVEAVRLLDELIQKAQ